MSGSSEALEMTVWRDGVVIVRAIDVLLAKAAFDDAVRRYPLAEIQLRHRARIIEWHKGSAKR